MAPFSILSFRQKIAMRCCQNTPQVWDYHSTYPIYLRGPDNPRMLDRIES